MTGAERHGDTSLGRGPGRFPSTCWSGLSGRLEDPGSPEGRRALEELAFRYWRPAYVYIRIRWARSNEDAKDLTQDFFLWMFETDFLRKADPGRGRFRGFIKTALERYLGHGEEKRRRIKRGGGAPILSLDAVDAAELPAGPDGASPGEAFDAAWKREILLRAAAILEQRLHGEGKGACYRLFRDFYFGGTDDPRYRDVAQRHGVSENDVENQLRYARRRCREIVSSLVAETAGSDADAVEEMRSLFGESLG